MKITIWFAENAYNVVVESVEHIWLLGPNTLGTQTFGNSSIVHRNVSSFEVDGFDFDYVKRNP